MKVKLKEIAEIRFGYPFRERIAHNAAGMYSVVQMKDMGENCQIDTAQLYKVDIDRLPPAHNLRKGDILFQNRGWRNCAAVLAEEMQGVVASSHLLVLRVNADVLPEYLAWYLNDAPMQGIIKSLAKGATIPVISKELFGELELEIPSIAVQKQIVELEELRRKEKVLVKEIEGRRSMLVGQICRNLAVQGN